MSTLIVEVVTVDAIIPIEKADRLVSAQVKGWFCVTGKENFQPGDKAVYIPIDSVVAEPTLSILFPPDSKIRPTNGRIRTIKIRGAVSQGMVVKLETLGLSPDLPVGTDVSSKLAITKYEPPTATPGMSRTQSCLCRKSDKNPNFKKYTGIENFKNYPTVFAEGEPVYITEKIHGTNFRCGWVPSAADTWWKRVKKFFGCLQPWDFVYGSHNVQLTNKFLYDGYYAKGGYGNVYAKIVKLYRLKEVLSKGEVLYGEIYGDGIQANYKYGCGTEVHALVAFDLMVNGEYVSPKVFCDWCDDHGVLPRVPILYIGPFSMDLAKKLTEGNSDLWAKQPVREGVVIKPETETTDPRLGRKILKLISDTYLLNKNNTDNH